MPATSRGEFSEDTAQVYHNPAGCTVATMRSAWPEISVSKSVAVAAGALDGSQPQLLTFDFGDDPIPVNATDLFFQVAYRGPLGAEQDGIAVGLVDVSEPTYFVFFNGTDYVLDTNTTPNTWRLATTAEPQPSSEIYLELCSVSSGGNWQIYLDDSQPLLPTHAARVAMLFDANNTLTITKRFAFEHDYDRTWISRNQATGAERDAPYEDGTGFNPVPFTYGRGIVVGDDIHIGENDPIGTGSLTYTTWDFGYLANTPQIPPLNSEAIGAVTEPGTTACSFTY